VPLLLLLLLLLLLVLVGGGAGRARRGAKEGLQGRLPVADQGARGGLARLHELQRWAHARAGPAARLRGRRGR
jgi:hypothetical protein